MAMTREELIQSLPFWLRERADKLLDRDAKKLTQMRLWQLTDEGIYFWSDCNKGKFDLALSKLKKSNPEVYELHYAKYFEGKLEESNFDWYTEEHNSIGSCAIAVCLALSKLDVSLPNEVAYNIGAIVHRYEELENKLKNI